MSGPVQEQGGGWHVLPALLVSGVGQAETKNGSFVILSSDSNAMRFRLTEDRTAAAPAPVPEIFTARFNGPDAMSLEKEGDPQVIPFVRSRPAY